MMKKMLASLAGVTVLLTTYVSAQDFCGCGENFWVDAEYIYWQIQDSPSVIPLVVEGPAVEDGTPVFDQPGYTTVIGNEKIKNDWRSGGRFGLGYWFDDQHCMGVEANYFFLPTKSRLKTIESTGLADSAFLTIPYFDVTVPGESSFSLADATGQFPFGGGASLKTANFMQGAEVNLLSSMQLSCESNIVFLAGFRYWNFNDRLSFDTNIFDVPEDGFVYNTQDRFRTQNNFYGGQIGAKWDYTCNQFFFNLTGKVALGALCQSVDINGQLSTNFLPGPEAPATYNGGFFALPTNIGKHSRTQFSVIPEVNFNFGYAITDSFRVKVGYTFLYVSNVLWASKQLDRNINPTQSVAIEGTPTPVLVGEAAPTASLKGEGLWVQGVNVGLEFSF